MEENLIKTCLHDRHVALGALMSPFGGFDMPIQYSTIIDEHNAVRNKVGVLMSATWAKSEFQAKTHINM